MTTEREPQDLPPKDLADGLEILAQAVELQQQALVQALWKTWNPSPRSHLLALMSDELRRQMMKCLGLMTGALVRWFDRAGDWVVRSLGTATASISSGTSPSLEWITNLGELELVIAPDLA